MVNGRDEEIRKRAYEIWEKEGRPEGKHQDHWSEAEREFGSSAEDHSDGSMNKQNGSASADADFPAPGELANSGKKRAASPRQSTRRSKSA